MPAWAILIWMEDRALADLPPALVAAFARRWIGTPYHPRAALRGIGADCVGLARGLHHELTGHEIAAPGWRADWPADRRAPMGAALRRYARPVPVTAARPGHLLVWRQFGVEVHMGIMLPDHRVIEAVEGRGVIARGIGDRVPDLGFAMPAPAGAVSAPDLTPPDCLAVIYPAETGAGVFAEITRQTDGAPVARTGTYPNIGAALDHLGPVFDHIEAVE